MELRLRKLGLIPEKEFTEAMRRGQQMEPFARDNFIKLLKINMIPCCAESTDYPFLGASLDGISEDGKTILEIKCGEKSFGQAVNGEIPEYYFAQMQHQLIVTRAEMCYYMCFDGRSSITIEVLPDADFEAHYIPIAEQFWMDLIFKEPEIFKENPKVIKGHRCD